MDNTVFQNHEKRKFDRRQLFYYLKVNHYQTHELAGYLADISTQGLMLFTKENVPLDKVFNFRINLDKELGMGQDLVFEARSLWKEKDVNPDYLIIGFRFIDMGQAGIDVVKYLITKYGFDA